MEILYITIAVITGLLGYFIGQKHHAAKLAVQENELNQCRNQILELKVSVMAAQDQKEILKEESITYKAEIGALKSTLATQIQEFKNIQDAQLEHYENVANKLFKENSVQFKEMNQESISSILTPLKEKIVSFETKVQETYEKQLKDSTSLKEQISSLADMSKQIGEDAVNLTNALKGDKKVQGSWGEILLESLLEKSGLEKETQYKTQVTLNTDTGDVRRPDVVIYLPDNKNLVIDSKVSLNAYSEYCNVDDVVTQKERFNEHVNAIKNHVKSLSEKKYEQLMNINTPDYVLMFIPIEPAFMLAMQDPNLFNYALERNIVIVTSSTLLATLRTVASIWKQESQKKHVFEIANESGKLYDKFVGFLDDMKSIEDSINKTKKSYDLAMNKLSEGSGNVMSRFERIKKLGAKASKTIDSNLLKETLE